MIHKMHCGTSLARLNDDATQRLFALGVGRAFASRVPRFAEPGSTMGSLRRETGAMAKNAKHQREAGRSKQQIARPIPLDQVSPAVLTASRDVAYLLEQFNFDPEPEDILKAVLERAEHLEQQAMGITVLDD